MPLPLLSISTLRKKDTIVLDDILIEEVWIVGGQSNMEWPLKRSEGRKEEIAKAVIQGIMMKESFSLRNPQMPHSLLDKQIENISNAYMSHR
ncbi:hypothetical protein ASD40_19190 [Paenibacillus sp. Root444D2]|nr:hypothetical protein ASD40_19190 [Paenibacillus sp. Root444D2]